MIDCNLMQCMTTLISVAYLQIFFDMFKFKTAFRCGNFKWKFYMVTCETTENVNLNVIVYYMCSMPQTAGKYLGLLSSYNTMFQIFCFFVFGLLLPFSNFFITSHCEYVTFLAEGQ